ncbi:DNA repair protein RAD4 isoform X2 [Aristolochia californica]|uniref:DNA repair protein RAD4 isoform X2 n=1 Tax=Aristolochia californica TaxID=171875 RepID=UPI0035DA73C2
MRGRKSSKRSRKNSGTISGTSKEAVDTNLNPATDESKRQEDLSNHGGISFKPEENDEVGNVKCSSVQEEETEDSSHGGIACKPEENDEVGNVKFGSVQEEETEDTVWEDGSVSISDNKTGNAINIEREVSHVTVEFTDSPSSLAKRKVARRASAEDKELAEWVHKVHLLCLLARGRLVDEACDDPLIQASLLSLLPVDLLKITELPKLTAKALGPLVCWFQSNFHVQNLGPTEGTFKLSLSRALETQAGTAEEVAALSVTLFRALNLTVRFVSMLDVTSLKPDMSTSGSSSQDAISWDSSIFSGSRKMVAPQNRVSTIIPVLSSQRTNVSRTNVHEQHQVTGSQTPTSNTYENKELVDKPKTSGAKSARKPKRKGDLEFELQLEMALAATAAAVDESEMDPDVQDPNCSSSDALLNRRKQPRTETDSVSAVQGSFGAAWSRKVGPPLYWAEVFCSGEAMTGRWVHVDAANSIVDGELKVESAAAACRRHLRYVVAFAGHGAKDVTRRYCMKWYTIAPYRINSIWWDAVLARLKELESGLTCAKVHLEGHMEKINDFASRSALEDVELETRALTEPLPSNQQAYKNHHLYALERWLTKYQILHPKGPVLGFCSGHPVYPRTCVQNLQSKQRWLREGLQVKANEKPAKVVRHSRKFIKGKKFESNVFADDDEDDGGGGGSDEGVIELYGKWQMEPLNLPHAVDGVVPKNEWGRVDVWSEKCLPPGTVHLRFPRLVSVAQRLKVDFAPAMVGFEFKNGRSFPVYEGIVVCSEFKDAIMEAYAEAEEKRESEEKKRHEAQVISRWYQLLSSIVTRQRLKHSYEDIPSSAALHMVDQRDDLGAAQNDDPKDKTRSSSYQQPVQEDIILGSRSKSFLGEHEHVFPIEHQSFDEENSIRTKRCPCGFSIRVEEM